MTSTFTEQVTTADYVAAVPALVKHYPEEIVCLLFFKRGRLHMSLTAEIDQDQHGFAAHIACVACAGEMDGVRIVVVARTARTGSALLFADILRDRFEEHGISVLARAHAWQIVRGAIWTDLDTQGGGIIPDPAISESAVAAIAAGHIILAARADFAARYTPTRTPDLITLRAASHRSHQPGFAAATLRDLAAHIVANSRPTAAVAARVSILTSISPAARDALLGLALLDIDAAASIYIDIANQLRRLPRAHMLAAAAVLYYATGQGVASHEAISHAQTAARDAKAENISLINVVTTLHEHAVHPAFVRRLLDVGKHAAENFDILVPEN